MSVLQSFLEDRSRPLATLQTYYPSMEVRLKNGKTGTEFPNRYFVMYGDSKVKFSEDQLKDMK